MKRRAFVGSLAASIPSLLLGRRLRSDEQFAERWSWVMGQPVHMMVFAASETEGLDACAHALAELRRIDAHLSLFNDASELCELNRRAGRGPMRLHHDLRAVLASAARVNTNTRGAFNVAIEPLMRAWGFHASRPAPPSLKEITAARAAVAAATILLDGDRATLPAAHTQLDLGGIGVGYGIDRALAVLLWRGIRRAFIDVSGDCAALDPPPGESGWLVEIADPDRPDATIARTRLAWAALATSANTMSVVRYPAMIVGHVMDPVTGQPADALRQVTVVARTATLADALATAMLVSNHRVPAAREVYAVARRSPVGVSGRKRRQS